MKPPPAVKISLLLAACGLFWSCSAPRKSDLAITHVTVIDATGAALQQEMTVVITDEHIAAFGPSSSMMVPRGARVINASGKFLIPGLAGMSGMRYRTFLLYNAAGGVLWATGFVVAGYAASRITPSSASAALTTAGKRSLPSAGTRRETCERPDS